jgi:pilus assembly protein CpaB
VQLETVEVLVATADMGRGQVIGPHDIGWQLWPAAAANPNFIKKAARPDAVQQFTGAIVRVPTASGEPIRDPMVVLAKGSGFLAAVLPQGMRAVSTEISPETGAGGFILPEDHVDVLLTRRDKAVEKVTGVERFISETILRNVRVLAIDQTVEEKNGQKVAVGKTATLELTPAQTEAIAVAKQQGTLSLALRSLADSPATMPEGGTGSANDSRINTIRFGVTTLTSPR